MSIGLKNYYKTCRELAGFTQEKASELLNISVKTLSNYENYKNKEGVPDDVVLGMVSVYRNNSLGWWHLKNVNPIGARCLPNFQEPLNDRETGFETFLAFEGLGNAKKIIANLLADGTICNEEIGELKNYQKIIENESGRLIAIKNFVDDRLENFSREVGL